MMSQRLGAELEIHSASTRGLGQVEIGGGERIRLWSQCTDTRRLENTTANFGQAPWKERKKEFNHLTVMPYFKITLIRSSIGMPKKTLGVLNALGLRKRTKTVFKPVNASTAGQIMKVKELVAISEVEKALTNIEMREQRRPDPGYYIETTSANEEHGRMS